MLFADGCRFLALATAQVIQFGASRFAGFFHFDLGDAGRMDWENALHTFAVGNATDRERLIQAASFTADDDALKNLNSFLIAFYDAGMNANTVSHGERIS